MTQRLLLAAGAVLLLTTGLVWGLERRTPEPVALTPTLTGEVEYCLTCHADLVEISPSHPVESYGCVLCHGGERLALDADLAHSSMRGGKNPSDLRVVEQSCGGTDCHSGSAQEWRHHIARVKSSIMATYAGAIASARYTFGAQADLAAQFGIRAVQDTTLPSLTDILSLEEFNPAVEANPNLEAFAAKCLDCHLWAEPRDGAAYTRLTGCAACHTPLPPLLSADDRGEVGVHTLTTAIPYTQCNTCHNRGHYDMHTLTFVERPTYPESRPLDYYPPTVQFARCELTLDCIDCHTHIETMGCGDIHADQLSIDHMCTACHGTLYDLPLTRTLTDPNDIAFRFAALNPVIDLQLGDTILVSEHRDQPQWNIRLLPDGTYELFSKVSGERFVFRAVKGSGCQQDISQQASQYCHACHAVER
jgi:hypothetical protein